MHAFLIIGKDNDALTLQIQRLAKDTGSKILEYHIQKIDDARQLNSFLKLSSSQRILIFVKNFQNATEECSNAMLKNLEEPQDNIIFALHARSENGVLPTIISRCKIIRLHKNTPATSFTDAEEFIKMNAVEKFNFLEKKNTRDEIIKFTGMLLEFLSLNLSTNKNPLDSYRMAKETITLRKSLEANGNIKLQILRFISHLSD